jgi:hypothetical protein
MPLILLFVRSRLQWYVVEVHLLRLVVRNLHEMAPCHGYTSIYSHNRRYRDHLYLIVCETAPVVKREHTWQSSVYQTSQHRSQSRWVISPDSSVLSMHALGPGHLLDV